jgi:hypothetical protein
MVLAIDLPLGLDVGLVRELVQTLKREIPMKILHCILSP